MKLYFVYNAYGNNAEYRIDVEEKMKQLGDMGYIGKNKHFEEL